MQVQVAVPWTMCGPIQLVFLNILHRFHQTKHRDTQNKSKPVSNQSVKKKKKKKKNHNFLHF